MRLIRESCCHLVARPSSLCAEAAIFLFFRPNEILERPLSSPLLLRLCVTRGCGRYQVQCTGSFYEKSKNTASAVIISGLSMLKLRRLVELSIFTLCVFNVMSKLSDFFSDNPYISEVASVALSRRAPSFFFVALATLRSLCGSSRHLPGKLS